MTAPDLDRRVQWIYTSKTNDELQERYDAWAADYDADVFSFGYVVPDIIAGLMGRYEPERGLILDAGAGTGIMGELLAHLGHKELVSMDLSPGMLDVADGRDDATLQVIAGG